MSNRLMIRYESDDFTHWSWVALDKGNKPIGEVGSGDLNQLATRAKGKRLVLIIASRSLLITSVDLPDGNARTISSAIPYAMEEQLAEDVDLMHFARGVRQNCGAIPVIAISKVLLTTILQNLADAGLHPTWAVAEPLLLPWKENELSISLTNTTAIVRDNEISGFECELKNLPILLKSQNPENSDLDAIRIWKQDDEIDINSLFPNRENKLIINKKTSDLNHLTEFGLKNPQINILQGFNEENYLQSKSSTWWPTIAISLLAITVYLGASGYQYNSIQKQIKKVTQNTEDLFRKTFPDVKRLVQPLVQAQQKLDQRKLAHGQGADDLLDLLYILGESKRKIGSIEFKNIEYRQNNMVIYLEGESVGQIERFKQQLEANKNATSSILSTISKGNKVEARIKLRVKSA